MSIKVYYGWAGLAHREGERYGEIRKIKFRPMVRRRGATGITDKGSNFQLGLE